LHTGLPAVFVRKRAKEYGTRQLAEGGDVRGKHLLVVEDVVTSGGQVAASAEALRSLGAVVTSAICVIDRESGGDSALRIIGINLQSLFRLPDLASDGQ
jgi:orotate phosphoribosyltransferase